jgi:putative ABC transport system substrate-binding protein
MFPMIPAISWGRKALPALCLALLCLLWLTRAAAAAPVVIGVLYPDIPPPYREVFTQIVAGVRATPGVVVRRYPLKQDADPAALRRWVRVNDCRAVIALGRRGVAAARALGDAVPVIAGAVLITDPPADPGMIGISLAPAPGRLFARLRDLAPEVRRVAVVYNPAHSAWLIARARVAARAQGLQLTALAARDLRAAVHRYRRIFEESERGRLALWLPQDPTTVNACSVLPLILQEAWNRDVAVFSSNPAYVARGVLFALYPDNTAMGTRLGRMALKAVRGDRLSPPWLRLLRDLSIAVNLRTADHLGLAFTGRQVQGFDLVFPVSR